MLSQREQQIWAEIERIYAAEADQVARVHVDQDAPRKRHASGFEDVSAAVLAGVSAVVLGVYVTTLLVVLGALLAGAVVGLGTALVWLLLRRWDRESPSSATEGTADGSADMPPSFPW
ncbi:DUF3040 domain-containing protein [Geodermatophilus sp. URMC 64]